jgi:hypothetical protein
LHAVKHITNATNHTLLAKQVDGGAQREAQEAGEELDDIIASLSKADFLSLGVNQELDG